MVAFNIMGPVFGTCLISRFWLIEFEDGFYIFGKLEEPTTYIMSARYIYVRPNVPE
jgi:hypothetical protein